MSSPEPIVVEFTLQDPDTSRIKKNFFMGASLEDVVQDTMGKFFRAEECLAHRVVEKPEAEQLNLNLYKEAYAAIIRGGQKCWYLEVRED